MAVVLVTGSSTGIGLATACHFARLGHEVHAGVRNPATAGELTRAIEADGLPIHVVSLDVDDGASVMRAAGQVLAQSGRVDVLVNNAGIGGGGPLADVPVDFAKAMFDTNYFGAIRMIQAVLPAMREQRGGAIVNISSVWGRVAVAGHGHYCAAKHALEAASEALAQEVYALGIRVAIVEPGVVNTPIFTKAKRFADADSPFAVHVRRLLLLYQLARQSPSEPEDVARVIEQAALGDTPRLRHVVGVDAQRVIDGRRGVSDEEYAATGREMPEGAFLALSRARYGF
ncbi:MAG TPA: SDR family oxidoreductase [Terriglobales bacterium]|nr:SDR family oxidoreductase [Terriglobales bacterium]